MLKCPECGSRNLNKSGTIRYIRRKPRKHLVERKRWLCLDCGIHTIIPVGWDKL